MKIMMIIKRRNAYTGWALSSLQVMSLTRVMFLSNPNSLINTHYTMCLNKDYEHVNIM